MIGLGVGIDYALFVVTRHRGFLREGKDPVEAAALANATSGTAVLFAGATVVVALLGLRLAGIPSIATMGYASAITVAVAMVAAVTLLPAFLGLAGTASTGARSVAGAHRRRATRPPTRRSPAAGLTTSAAPVALHHRRASSASSRSPRRCSTCAPASPTTAWPSTDAHLSPGVRHARRGIRTGLQRSVHDRRRPRGRRRCHRVDVESTMRWRRPTGSPSCEPVISPPAPRRSITAIPTTSPPTRRPKSSSTRSATTSSRRPIGDATGQTYVTGQTAAFIDISERLARRLPIFIVAVVGAVIPAADARVPVGAGAAQGGGDEPALDRQPPTASSSPCSSGAGATS